MYLYQHKKKVYLKGTSKNAHIANIQTLKNDI